MKFKLLLSIMLAHVVNLDAQSPDWTWTKSNGGTDYDWGQSIAADASGNTVVVGAYYSPTIAFGTMVLTNPNAGKYNSFIVRHDANGNVLWAKQPISIGWSKASGVGIDNFNNIIISGYYSATTITFDTITLTKSHCCFLASYIVKYDPSGNIIWAKTTYGESDGSVAYPPQPQYVVPPTTKIAVSKNNGDVYVTGTFDTDTMFFGSTIITNANMYPGQYPNRDVFIAKYNSSGNFVWAKSIGGNKNDITSDISTNDLFVFVTGAFSSNLLNIGSSTLVNPNGSASTEEPFVAKFDSSGNPIWAKQGISPSTGLQNAIGKSVTVDVNGNCLITGQFYGPFIVFDSDTLVNATGSTEIFVLKYDSAGNIIWTKASVGNGMSWAQAIQTDGVGNVYVGGSFYNSISFDSITIFPNNYGLFVAKFTPSGSVLWAKSPGGGQKEHLVGLSVTDVGNVYLTGEFEGNIYFGIDTLISNGLSDIFTAVILNCSPSFSVITAQSNTTFCQGDSVILSASPGYINYQWYRRNFPIPGATSMNYIAKSGGRYRCKSQNATLCIDTSNVITVNVPCIPIGPNHERAIVQIESENQNFGIYPNPGTGIFVVESFSGQLNVFDSLGQLVLSTEVNDKNFKFDISNHSNGIYFVTLNTGDKINYQKLFLLH